jgi:hypothetical protein
MFTHRAPMLGAVMTRTLLSDLACNDDRLPPPNSYDTARGSLVRRKITSITGQDISFAVVSFNVNMSDIVIVSSRGRYTRYNLERNVSVHKETLGNYLSNCTFVHLLSACEISSSWCTGCD